MTQPVAHINLLQRVAPAHTMAMALAAALILSVALAGYYASVLRGRAAGAEARRDAVAQQLVNVKAKLAAKSGEVTRSAQAKALSTEVEALKPEAQAAQTLLEQVGKVDSGRSEDFARTMAAMAGVVEPGLWLTSLTVSGGGKKLELQGQASSGAAVLRYARRANEALQPLKLRLDTLEVTPATPVAGAAPAATSVVAGTVSFRLN